MKFLVKGKESKPEPTVSLELVQGSDGSVTVWTSDGWTIGMFKDGKFLRSTSCRATGVVTDSAGRIEVV